MAKLKNPSKTQQKAMLDRRWSAFIRSHGKCESCGTLDNLTESHIIGRSYIKTRFDPRNNQCLCFSCHGAFESQPIAFARWVESTTCGQYVDIMLIQGNALPKPDYELWLKIYDIIMEREYTVEQAREWLGLKVLLSENQITSIL